MSHSGDRQPQVHLLGCGSLVKGFLSPRAYYNCETELLSDVGLAFMNCMGSLWKMMPLL